MISVCAARYYEDMSLIRKRLLVDALNDHPYPFSNVGTDVAKLCNTIDPYLQCPVQMEAEAKYLAHGDVTMPNSRQETELLVTQFVLRMYGVNGWFVDEGKMMTTFDLIDEYAHLVKSTKNMGHNKWLTLALISLVDFARRFIDISPLTETKKTGINYIVLSYLVQVFARDLLGVYLSALRYPDHQAPLSDWVHEKFLAAVKSKAPEENV